MGAVQTRRAQSGGGMGSSRGSGVTGGAPRPDTHRAQASPERGGGTAVGRDGEVLRGIEFMTRSAKRELFNLSVASGDSSPFRGAFR